MDRDDEVLEVLLLAIDVLQAYIDSEPDPDVPNEAAAVA